MIVEAVRIEVIVEVVRIEVIVEVVRIEVIVWKMVREDLVDIGGLYAKVGSRVKGSNIGTPASKIREYGIYAPAVCDRTSSDARELPSVATLP